LVGTPQGGNADLKNEGLKVATSLHKTAIGAEQSQAVRLLFVDNLRWTLIVLVICHHAAVTYSHVGGWYYLDGTKPSLLASLPLATFETFNQAFFMGILFLLAGYFVPGAYDSKGGWRFLRDRSMRLGIPTLFFMLVLAPVIKYWLLRFDDPSRPTLAEAYPRFLTVFGMLSASGPMWFALALLIFCFVYGLYRFVSGGEGRAVPLSVPNHLAVVGLMLVMGSGSFLVRIIQPIGTNVFNMQLCFFSQYILLFCVGIMAYRGDWLRRVNKAFGLFWFRVSLLGGIPGWIAIVGTTGPLRGDTKSLLGGLTWQSAAFCFWESFFCVGVCLGLIVIFRERFNSQDGFARWMSQNSFSAYLFHPPLLIAVTLVLRPVPLPPLAKFVMACLIAVPTVFLVSGLLRERVPGLRRLL